MEEENYIKVTGDLEELDKVFRMLALRRFHEKMNFDMVTSKSVADYSTEKFEGEMNFNNFDNHIIEEEEEEEEEEKKPTFNINNVIRSRSEVFFTFEGIEYSLIPSDIDTDVQYGYLFRDENLQVIPDYSYVYALTHLNKVPFTKEDIKKVIGVNGEWRDLEIPVRFDFIKKLEPRYYKNLYVQYEKVKYGGLTEEIKNS